MSDTKNGIGQRHPIEVYLEDQTLVGLGERTPLFVLGFFDREMHTIEQCLPVGTVRRATMRNQIVGAPSEAYRVDDVRLDDAVTGHTVRVWVECRPEGMSRRDLEARGDIVIDHHEPGDRGFGESRTTHLWSASSLGQVTAVMTAYASQKRGLVDAVERLCDSSVIVRACVDHALGLTLSGAALGVHPWSAVLAMALDATDPDMARTTGRAPTARSVEEFIGQVVAARAAVEGAATYRFGEGAEFANRTQSGPIPQLAVGASLAGRGYITTAPSRPGVPDAIVVGGLTTPQSVRAFMAVARVASLSLPPEVRAKTPKGDGVYGDPARGFAGTYAPLSILTAARDAVLSLRRRLREAPSVEHDAILRGTVLGFLVPGVEHDVEAQNAAVRLLVEAAAAVVEGD